MRIRDLNIIVYHHNDKKKFKFRNNFKTQYIVTGGFVENTGNKGYL